MNDTTTQMILAAILGIALALAVVRFSRKGNLSFRYTVGWLVVASLGALAGFFLPLVSPIAELLGLSAAALLSLTALATFSIITIQLSISISGLQQQNRKLAEDLARVRLEVKLLAESGS